MITSQVEPVTGTSVTMHSNNTRGENIFKGKDVASPLGYRKPKKAIQTHVCDKYKLTFRDIQKEGGRQGAPKRTPYGTVHPDITFINEPGLYTLIFIPEKERNEHDGKGPPIGPLSNRQHFKDWIFEDVLPSIRKTGKYDTTTTQKLSINIGGYHCFSIMNETDLHKQIIKFIRNKYPDVKIIPGLGELQTTQPLRLSCWGRDTMVDNLTYLFHIRVKDTSGYAWNLKHQTGKAV
jgi:prophage antirepressor-like protein